MAFRTTIAVLWLSLACCLNIKAQTTVTSSTDTLDTQHPDSAMILATDSLLQVIDGLQQTGFLPAASDTHTPLAPHPTDIARQRAGKFKATQIIIPGTLLTLGIVGAATDWNESYNGNPPHPSFIRKMKPEKWIQYLPTALNIGLNLCGKKSKFNTADRLLAHLTSIILANGIAITLKKTVSERRPNGADDNSFPSGHCVTAFRGAELVRMEHGGWYAVAAYAMATGVAVQRVVYKRHWVHDVLAGAGIGVLCARAAYWLLPLERRLMGLDKKPKKSALVVAPFYDTQSKGGGGSLAWAF